MYTLKYFNALTREYTYLSIILYFNYTSLKALLKNYIGFSQPSTFFCNNKTTIKPMKNFQVWCYQFMFDQVKDACYLMMKGDGCKAMLVGQKGA